MLLAFFLFLLHYVCWCIVTLVCGFRKPGTMAAEGECVALAFYASFSLVNFLIYQRHHRCQVNEELLTTGRSGPVRQTGSRAHHRPLCYAAYVSFGHVTHYPGSCTGLSASAG
ncbi:uncharacterized protein BYT42DRAFT_577216 [Radiomyces spectabilis]|uniref:uncharacterized protein n=1 Tax=Radiomyces spectabilis TaxID=64574 RepID=UPI0022206D6E|nr:uncharacterized protein BYT42DRAFT_577216 [Radiomyces spectabilis]KAI8374675.1 hypothetical protein BYT42DRAFT_577216 [Radiomyces spectabilis]